WKGVHNGQINIGFVDGHAKSLTVTQAWDKCIMGDQGNLYWWLDDDCGLE
ncbi:MAG: H-X9-DG-CTERM domain-containing protein, partial [Armatimonadota bacterium]